MTKGCIARSSGCGSWLPRGPLPHWLASRDIYGAGEHPGKQEAPSLALTTHIVRGGSHWLLLMQSGPSGTGVQLESMQKASPAMVNAHEQQERPPQAIVVPPANAIEAH